jgi:hypothetical protein
MPLPNAFGGHASRHALRGCYGSRDIGKLRTFEVANDFVIEQVKAERTGFPLLGCVIDRPHLHQSFRVRS